MEVKKKIVDALKENGYLSSFIRKHSCPTRHRQEVDVRKPRPTVTLPYIHGLSEAVRRIFTQSDIKVVFCLLITLHHMLVHPKDPVPLYQQKGVVHSRPCNGCHKVYIGQTGRNPQISTGRISTGSEEWWCSCINPRRAHFGHRPPTGPHQSWSHWPSSAHYDTMPIRKLAHSKQPRHTEQGERYPIPEMYKSLLE